MTVRRAAVAALAAGLLLGGCAGDPEPRFAEPTDPPSSPAGSNTSDAAARQSPEEFIREWFRLNTEMQNTGDTEAFRARSTQCRSCLALARQVQKFYSNGGYISIERQSVVEVRRVAHNDYLVLVDAAPTRYRETGTSAVRRLPGGINEYRIQIHRHAAEWALRDYQDTPS